MKNEARIEYLEQVLKTYETNDFGILKVESKVRTLLNRWMGTNISNLLQMGSHKQQTSIYKGKSEIDLDVLVVFPYDTKLSLPEIHDSLFKFLKKDGLKPVKRNISMRIEIDGIAVDLAPAIKIPGSDDHHVWSRKQDIEFRSNPEYHIQMVKASRQQKTIKLVKLWAHLHGLDWESFYITLVCLNVLQKEKYTDIAHNFRKVLFYLATRFQYDKYSDPIEIKDCLSDHMTDKEKKKISKLAEEHLLLPLDEVLY